MPSSRVAFLSRVISPLSVPWIELSWSLSHLSAICVVSLKVSGEGPLPRLGEGETVTLREVSHAYTIVLGQSTKAAGRTLPHRPELPLIGVPIDLTDDHRRLRAHILGQVKACELGASRVIDNTCKGLTYHPKILFACLRFVDGDNERQFFDLGRDLIQGHIDDLVVTLADTGKVVTQVLH